MAGTAGPQGSRIQGVWIRCGFVDAADRCLFAANASGGRVVKSIDVLA